MAIFSCIIILRIMPGSFPKTFRKTLLNPVSNPQGLEYHSLWFLTPVNNYPSFKTCVTMQKTYEASEYSYFIKRIHKKNCVQFSKKYGSGTKDKVSSLEYLMFMMKMNFNVKRSAQKELLLCSVTFYTTS